MSPESGIGSQESGVRGQESHLTTDAGLPAQHPQRVDFAVEQDMLTVAQSFLQDVVTTVLQEEGVREFELSVAIVDDAAIQALNRQFLRHDYPTDVLSFRLDDGLSAIASPPGAARLEGEVILSAETALRAARERGVSPQEELCLYLVHGLLHLCGYDDRDPENRRRMRQRETGLLKNWNMQPHHEGCRTESGSRRQESGARSQGVSRSDP